MGIDRLLIEGLSACLGQTDLASSQIVDTVRDVGDNAGQLHLRQRAVCRNEPMPSPGALPASRSM